MEFRYDIDADQHLIRLIFTGSCTLFGLIDAATKVLSDRRYSRDFDGLADLTQASPDLSLRELEYFAHFMVTHRRAPRGDWGIKVVSPKATALAMLYRQKAAPLHFLFIFSTVEGLNSFFACRRSRFLPHRAAA